MNNEHEYDRIQFQFEIIETIIETFIRTITEAISSADLLHAFFVSVVQPGSIGFYNYILCDGIGITGFGFAFSGYNGCRFSSGAISETE
jgi:hypothetical protein